ncbi:hypothetical protein SLS62_005160 [Diatrype stigma]|uniref:Uncharacterized protein n=1 Tax=Diatrype stigma TaxID=117547 RepID=A0AAN9US15_9PEZI
MTPHASKFYSTSQVHPTYLPALHKSGRIEKKLAIAAVAAVGVGYGLKKYKEIQIDRQEQYAAQSMSMREAEERRRSEAMMMDAYGDRSSLDSLEAAVKAYDSQRQATSSPSSK